MEVRKPKIKSMKYEDFTDNEYLEKMIEELRANGTNVVMGLPGRSYQLGPQQQPLAAYVRHELLRYRIYGGRCRTLRFCPLRV